MGEINVPQRRRILTIQAAIPVDMLRHNRYRTHPGEYIEFYASPDALQPEIVIVQMIILHLIQSQGWLVLVSYQAGKATRLGLIVSFQRVEFQLACSVRDSSGLDA
jgi:hypothetical protein